MPDHISKLGKELLGVTIFEAAKELAKLVFVTAVSAGLAAMVSQLVEVLRPLKWYLIVAASSAAFWLTLVITRRLRRFSPTFGGIESDFWVVEKHVRYEYRDASHMTYKKRLRLRALKDGLDAYRDKYHWTGSGSITVASTKPEQTFVETGAKSVWKLYEIRFDKALSRGEEIETELEWILEDKDGKAVPFVSATIEEPTDSLILSVKLAAGLGVREVIREHSYSIGAKRPFEERRAQLDEHGEDSWTIPRPGLLHHYEVRWRLTR